MSFLKDIRRRSKASFRASTSFHESSPPNGDTSSDRLSSTLDSSHSSHKNPPSSVANGHPSSNTNGTLPQRPAPFSSQSNRSSVVGINSLAVNGSPRPPPPTSPLAPRIESVSENSWVHQKLLLVYGQIGDVRHRSVGGCLTVVHTQESFPPMSWPVKDMHFKALVHLFPGPNKIRFDYGPPGASHGAVHSSWININYLPLLNAPPLHLAIVLAKDSGDPFDMTPKADAVKDETTLDIAVRKFRTAAYLWQAVTGDGMYRNNFGRRCFRYDEGWQPGTLNSRDFKSGQMRSEAKVHIIRCDETVAELRALSTIQGQGTTPTERPLYQSALNAVRNYFNPQPGQNQYVSAVFLDSCWEGETGPILGNAAAGTCEDDIKMALVGSSSLHSYPTCMEEAVSALTNGKQTHGNRVVNGDKESDGDWGTATLNVGAHLRETGRVLGCPHGVNGIMNHDDIRFNRAFATWEPVCTGTKTQGLQPCPKDDEPYWGRLDTLRFRFHPCFRLPTDTQVSEESIQVWPVDNGKLLVTSPCGIAFVEIFVDEDEMCGGFIEYVNADAGNGGIPKLVTLTEQGIRHHLPDRSKKSKKLRIVIYSGGLRTRVVDNVGQLKSKQSVVKLPKGQIGYRGGRVGSSRTAGSSPEELILECTTIQTKLLVSVKLHIDKYITGIEFCYEDSTSQLFGRQTSEPAAGEFVFDTRRGEVIMGFYLRFGLCLEGIEILTSLGRKSGFFGSATSGFCHTLIPPRGYSVAGVSGSVGSYIDSFALIITR